MNLTRSSFGLSIIEVIENATTFIAILFFARELGSTGLGFYFLFETVLMILSYPSDFALRESLVKRMSEGEKPGKFFGGVFVLKIPLLILVILLIVIYRGLLNSFIGFNATQFLLLALPIREFGLVVNKSHEGRTRVLRARIIRTIGKIGWAGFGVVLILTGLNHLALVYSLLFRYIAITVLSLYGLDVHPKFPSFSEFQSLIEYSKYSMLGYAGNYVYNWADTTIIGYFLGSSAVGLYEVAWRLSSVFMIVGKSIANAQFPRISLWHENKDYQRIGKSISNAIIPALILIIPGIAGAAVIGHDLLRVLYGKEYTAVSVVLLILISEKGVNSMRSIFKKCLTGIDRPDLSAVAHISGLIVNVFFNILLVLYFGLIGAAVATSLGSVLDLLLHYLFLKERVEISIPVLKIGWCAVAASVMGIVVNYLIRNNTLDLLELIIIINIGAVIYLFIVLLYTPIRKDAISLVKSSLL